MMTLAVETEALSETYGPLTAAEGRRHRRRLTFTQPSPRLYEIFINLW